MILLLLFTLNSAFANGFADEYPAIKKCLEGLFSQPYRDDRILPKPRGQSLYLHQASGFGQTYTYDIILLPKLLEDEIELTFVTFKEQKLASSTYRISRSQLKQNEGLISIKDFKPSCESAAKMFRGGPEHVVIIADAIMPCTQIPLTLKLEIIPYPKSKDGAESTRQQIIATLMTDKKSVEKGNILGKDLKSTGEFNRPKLLSDLYLDLAEHIKNANMRSESAEEAKLVPWQIKKCDEYLSEIKFSEIKEEYPALLTLMTSITASCHVTRCKQALTPPTAEAAR